MTVTHVQEGAQEHTHDGEELGMAANSILQSIPPHVLKALEQQQNEANVLNAESKVCDRWEPSQAHIHTYSEKLCRCCALLVAAPVVCGIWTTSAMGCWHLLDLLLCCVLVVALCLQCIFNAGLAMCLPLQVSQQASKKTILEQTTESDTVVCQANRKKKKKAVGQATLGSMRIITGSAAGRRLVSPPGEGTRPMMEKVRGAVFSMVASMAGSQPLLPPGSRWLDLFAGTGNPLLVFHALQTQLYASTGCYGRTTWFQSHEHEALHLPCSLYAAMQTCQL